MCIESPQIWGHRELYMKENNIMWMLELWLSCSAHAVGPTVCLQNVGSGETGR